MSLNLPSHGRSWSPLTITREPDFTGTFEHAILVAIRRVGMNPFGPVHVSRHRGQKRSISSSRSTVV
jgi:hypothetical protein